MATERSRFIAPIGAAALLLIFGEGARATAKGRDRAPVPAGAPDTRIQAAP